MPDTRDTIAIQPHGQQYRLLINGYEVTQGENPAKLRLFDSVADAWAFLAKTNRRYKDQTGQHRLCWPIPEQEAQ